MSVYDKVRQLNKMFMGRGYCWGFPYDVNNVKYKINVNEKEGRVDMENIKEKSKPAAGIEITESCNETKTEILSNNLVNLINAIDKDIESMNILSKQIKNDLIVIDMLLGTGLYFNGRHVGLG